LRNQYHTEHLYQHHIKHKYDSIIVREVVPHTRRKKMCTGRSTAFVDDV
jgi:hypothetical protein